MKLDFKHYFHISCEKNTFVLKPEKIVSMFLEEKKMEKVDFSVDDDGY